MKDIVKVFFKNSEGLILLNTAYQIIGKIITSFLGVISFGLLAHYFTPFQVGEYNLVINFVGFLVVFADFGLGTLLTREIASRRANEQYIASVFGLRFSLSILIAIIGSILITYFPYSKVVKTGVIVYAIANIFYLLSMIIWSIFQANLDFRKIVSCQIFTSLLITALFIAGMILQFSLLNFILLSSIGLIAGFICTLLLYKPTFRLIFNLSKFRMIFKEAWPFGVGAIVSVFYFKIDSLILPYFYNPSFFPDLGYYTTAYKIFEVVSVIGGFYTTTLFPFFAANFQSKEFYRHLKKFFFYTFLLAFIGSIGLFVFAKLFIFVIGGAKYAPAIPALHILSFAVSVSILNGFFLNIGVVGRKQKLLLYFAIIAAFLNVGLNLFIIPKYSFIGASWTTLVTQLFILLTNIYIAFLTIRQKKSGTIHA